MEAPQHSTIVELLPLVPSECPICLDNKSTSHVNYTTLECCKNSICKHCICAWIACRGLSASCPFCRDNQSIYNNINCSDLIDYIITCKSMDADHTDITKTIGNINEVLQQKYNLDNIVIQIDYQHNNCVPEQVSESRGSRFLKMAKGYLFITIGCGMFLYTTVLIIKSTM